MTDFPAWLVNRLKKIACLDDKLANMHLENTGSYSYFDEPGSVRIAREILADMERSQSHPPQVREGKETYSDWIYGGDSLRDPSERKRK